jgi:hypothetical protein
MPESPIIPPPSIYNQYCGWGFPNGSLPNQDLMVVMPGWNNQHGWFVYRDQGRFYVENCWNRVMIQKPAVIVINSFNEFAELTAMEIADTRNLPMRDQWRDSTGKISVDMYWNITKTFMQGMHTKLSN